MLEAGDSISSPSFSLLLSVVLSDVVTKPDCNCLYPKATPSSDLASVSPQQFPTPSTAPMAGLTWADSEATDGSSLLPKEQALRTVDPGSAKQRPPRSTCQTFESPETPRVEGRPPGDSPQPGPSVAAPVTGMEDILDSLLGANMALEEASGEASEGPEPQGAEFSSYSLGGRRVQTEPASPSHILPASSALSGPGKGLRLAGATSTHLPTLGPMRPTEAWSHTPEKTDRPAASPRDHQEPGLAKTPALRPQGLSSPSARSSQPKLPRSHSWGHVLSLGELEGRRSTRDRRSPTQLKGGQASEGAARPPARFNSVPLTDAGHERQHKEASDPQLPGFVFRLLVPSIILVLLAVGGLLFYRRRRRVRRAPWGRGGRLVGWGRAWAQQQGRDDLGSGWALQTLRDRKLIEHRGWEVQGEGFFKNGEGSGCKIDRRDRDTAEK